MANSHPGAYPQSHHQTVQPEPGAESNAFDSGQSNFQFFVWGNGTMYQQTPNPFGAPIYHNYAIPVNGLGGIVTGQLVHVPLQDENGNDTGIY
jgi:hypothetical protein